MGGVKNFVLFFKNKNRKIRYDPKLESVRYLLSLGLFEQPFFQVLRNRFLFRFRFLVSRLFSRKKRPEPISPYKSTLNRIFLSKQNDAVILKLKPPSENLSFLGSC